MTEYKQLLIDGHAFDVCMGQGHGDGPRVVFLHGILGSVRFWEPILPREVRDSICWYSVSLPAHSRHPAAGQKQVATANQWAALILRALETQLGHQRFSLVGWSTGGFLALDLASRYPSRVQSVLSIAGFAHGRFHGLLGALQKVTKSRSLGDWTFRSVISLLQKSRSVFDWAYRCNAVDREACRMHSACRDILEQTHQDFRHFDVGALYQFFQALRCCNILNQLQRIHCPTTIVAGTHDPIIRWKRSQELARAIPQSRLVAWRDCGHLFFAERRRLFIQLLREWIRDLPQQHDHNSTTWKTVANDACAFRGV